MSYDESDEEDEWEVVDIVHTTTSVKPNKKAKPAKKEDVDRLAQDIQTQLSLKSTHDTQQILLLEQKMKQQQMMSEQQLAMIQSKLSQLTMAQHKQDQQQRSLDEQRRDLEERQKQALLEQQIKIQSLSDHQMLTQKQIMEAHQQIQQTQQVTQNVNDNMHSLQQQQQQQQLQHQLTEHQIQSQLQPLQEQTQQQLAQIAALQAQQQNPFQPLPQIPAIQPIPQNINFSKLIPPPPPQIQTNNNNNNNNGWLPSFFVFGNKNGNNTSNTNVQDMDMTSSPHLNAHMCSNQEEKEPVLMDHDDDDVLRWNNDYGAQQLNPLHNNPQLLKTKGVIGEGKFQPNEKRQCGWILINKSSSLLKICGRLECIGGDREQFGIQIVTEKEYVFSLQPNEEIYILVEVEAPPMIGQYAAFYQLVIDNGVKIGEMLEIMCQVVSDLSEQKERMIEQIIKMGFDDRKQVIETLKKLKWNVQASVDKLIGL